MAALLVVGCRWWLTADGWLRKRALGAGGWLPWWLAAGSSGPSAEHTFGSSLAGCSFGKQPGPQAMGFGID